MFKFKKKQVTINYLKEDGFINDLSRRTTKNYRIRNKNPLSSQILIERADCKD